MKFPGLTKSKPEPSGFPTKSTGSALLAGLAVAGYVWRNTIKKWFSSNGSSSRSTSKAPANGSVKAALSSTPSHQGKNYENWTKEELYEKAKDEDIEGRSTMTKEELIEALRAS